MRIAVGGRVYAVVSAWRANALAGVAGERMSAASAVAGEREMAMHRRRLSLGMGRLLRGTARGALETLKVRERGTHCLTVFVSVSVVHADRSASSEC